MRFDDNGGGTLDIPGLVHPASVVVSNATVTYEMTTSTGSGGITRNTGLKKQGAGSLTLDVDNTSTGPTVIEEGVVTVGFGGVRGSLGSGAITNRGTSRFDRTGTVVITNIIDGSGTLVKDNTGFLRLMGANTMSGPILLNRGSLAAGPGGLGNATSMTLTGVGTGDGTSLYLTTNALGQGVVVGSGVTLDATAADIDNRAGVINEGGTNVFNGQIVVNGAGPVIVRVAGGSLEMNGPIRGDTFSDVVSFRGSGSNFLHSHINLPAGGIQKDDAGTWTVTSIGPNTNLSLRMLAGTLKLGNNNALATTGFIKTDGGILDLAGFNQTVSGLANFRTNAVTTITNSSASGDSRLSVVTAPTDPTWISGVILADANAGPTRKVSLSLSGGATLTLTNVSTYRGDTSIDAGTLALSVIGRLANSTPIILAAGATLDASGRTDGTLTLGPNQLLKGNGTVAGTLAVQGTLAPGSSVGTLTASGNVSLSGSAQVVMEVNNTAGTKDLLEVGGTLAYGGTLTITNIGATPYTPNQVIKLFNAAGGYSSAFTSINFSGVAAYDASNLALDGTIKVLTLASAAPVNVAAAVTGGGSTLALSWPADHISWRLLGQTNAPGAGLSTNWFYVEGSASTNQVFLPLVPTVGSAFYRLVFP